MGSIRIAVIDDHPLFREGVVRSLSEIDEFEIVGQGANAEEAISIATTRSPDIMLIDVSMPGNGVSAVDGVLKGSPRSRVIMLTVSEDSQDVTKAIGNGAAGYVLKGVSAQSLVEIVRAVGKGQNYVSPTLSAQLFAELSMAGSAERPENPLSRLSAKEMEVLALVGAGQSNKRVALALDLHEKSIKRYLTQIFRKLQVSNRTEASIVLRDNKPTFQGPRRAI